VTLTPRRLIAAAALFHVAIVASLFVAGRMQIAPRFVDRTGLMPAVAVDSLNYQSDALRLAAALARGGLAAWKSEPAAPHVRAISLLFALFGNSTLAVEPLNLVCYLAVVGLVFAIGREVGGDRVGLAAAVIIALWPTFVLHTTQFLKDPLFIAGALAMIFVLVTWLTRTYERRHAIVTAVVLIAATSMMLLIRPKFAVAVFALVTFGLALLVARQILERRLLVWNLICAAVTLAAASALMFAHASPRMVFKAVPSATRGASKSAPSGLLFVPSLVAWRPPAHGALDRAGFSLGMLRNRYNRAGNRAGSQLDDTVEVHNGHDLIAYLPRAAAVGLWAPFPSMWLRSGQTVGTAGRIISGAETAAIYLCELLAIIGIILAPRRLAPLLLLVIAAFGVTGIALVVTNIGTLYRFRYSFWALIIVAGVSGFDVVRQRVRRTPILLALFLASCSQQGAPLTIENYTTMPLDAIYLAPHDAPTWEENLLGGTALGDSEAIAIRFGPGADRVHWDLRIEGGGDRAEWLDLDLTQISSMTLRLVNERALADCERRSD